jgi:hypothetical protein
MDFVLAFSFPFKDEKWISKILIAGLIGLIPVIGWIVLLGWQIEVIRRVIQGSNEPLPDWSGFGDYLILGLKGIVIALIYSLPIILLSIPVPILSSILDSADASVVVAIISFCFSCISLLYGIVLAFVIPAAFGRLAATNRLVDAFNLSAIWGLVRNALGSYVIAIIGTIIASFVGTLGVIACFIGIIFTWAYYNVVAGHLYGQAYREGAAASSS